MLLRSPSFGVHMKIFIGLILLLVLSWSPASAKEDMYVQTLTHIPEVITGLGGAALIGISLWSSIRYNRQERQKEAHMPERERLHA